VTIVEGFEVPRRKKPYTFITAECIAKAYKEGGFFGLIVYGPQNIGKSSYMLKVMAELYNYDWNKVFKHVVFSLEDLIRVMKRSMYNRIKVIGWDDAGVHGHKYVYFEDPELVRLVEGWLHTIKTRLGGLIITTLDPESLMKPLRVNLGMLQGEVERNGGPYRVVTVYRPIYIPGLGRRYPKVYRDHYNVMLPDEVYKRYDALRKSYYYEAEDRLRGRVEEKLAKIREKREKVVEGTKNIRTSSLTVQTITSIDDEFEEKMRE